MAPETPGGLRARPMPSASPSLCLDDSFQTLRYEHTMAAKAPIPVTVPPPRSPPTDMHPALRRPVSGLNDAEDPTKRDSGLANITSTTVREGSVTTAGSKHSTTPPSSKDGARLQAQKAPELPKSDSTSSMSRWKMGGVKKDSNTTLPELKLNDETQIPNSDGEFSPLTTPIPSDTQLELNFMDQLSFSKRGSVLLGGKKAINGTARPSGGRRLPSFSMIAVSSSTSLSTEIEMESQKVRSMYEVTPSREWSISNLSVVVQSSKFDIATHTAGSAMLDSIPDVNDERPGSAFTARPESILKNEHELAGGIEDWEDVEGKDVDRYGFIVKRRESARVGTPEPRPGVQRVSTVLQLVSEAPRKRRGLGRSLSTAKSSRSTLRRSPSHRKGGPGSINTQATSSSRRSFRSQPFRSAANRFPGNQDRRWMDEAGDMLTLPPGLADIAEDEEGGRAAEGVKRKEWSRAEKWRKMARVVKTGINGEGMEFDFDVRNPKLIERTWKGIPDRWRSTAWHSFLSASAKKTKGSASDEEIISSFHKLVSESSADDVQIDMDVPRTINSHIMFRRRYRGGQRLLFRVLHSLSLYFPVTGYVQGMASLAATLLCYYDEENTFIMLVRMWSLRGLDKLYASGFAGLMGALDEFQKDWMKGNDVSKKLDELGIEPTAYGTRWYLTLFNYSIPFPAQLRVWDVFMLLGDLDPSLETTERPFGGGLDVLHAASAALIDGTREILLDSDFENVMKVLTSWIPVKDEELFMKVAKAEWKLHHGKKSSA